MRKNKQSRGQRVKEGQKNIKKKIKNNTRKKDNKKKLVHSHLMREHALVKRHKMLLDIMEKARAKQKEEADKGVLNKEVY